MSDWELRFLLLILGVAILIVIYVLGEKKQSPTRRDHAEDDDMDIESLKGSLVAEPEVEDDDTQEMEAQAQKVDEILNGRVIDDAEIGASQTPASPPSREQSTSNVRRDKPMRDKPSKVVEDNLVILHIAAKPPNLFMGKELLRAFSDVGLEYDKSKLFYRYAQRFSEKLALFGAVNSVNPGTFDLEHMGEFRTPSISLFMRLPVPMESLKAFNIMLDCAQNLAHFLNAELYDKSRSAITKQTIDHMREEIQLYSLRHGQLKKAKA
jgi:cell division protein ZipA